MPNILIVFPAVPMERHEVTVFDNGVAYVHHDDGACLLLTYKESVEGIEWWVPSEARKGRMPNDISEAVMKALAERVLLGEGNE